MGKRHRGLTKWDFPLSIQFSRGEEDFKRGNVTSPFKENTTTHREWMRGFNRAYFAKKEELA